VFDLITKINSNINYGMKFIHDPPVCSSKINLDLKYSTMKKVITGMGLMQFILMILFLFFIVTLSACNLSKNVSMKEKGLIMDQLNDFKPSIEDRHNADTINETQSTGDFRYDYLLK
jgi:hypothetical protein